MGIVSSNSLSNSSRSLTPTPPTLVSTDIISEQKSQGETARAATDGKAAASPASGDEAKPVVPSSAAPDRGPLMMTAIPGGGASALPGPLQEKRFAGEMEGDFAAAIAMVEPGGPAGRRRSHRSIWGSLIRLLRLDRLRG